MSYSKIPTPEKLTVYFHKGCADGTAAAWAISKLLPHAVQDTLRSLGGIAGDITKKGPTVDEAIAAGIPIFLGISHQQELPEPTYVGRQVIFVDISHQGPVLANIAAKATGLTVLDHHRSAIRDLDFIQGLSTVEIVHDEARSGAEIAWDWGHLAAERPEMISYIGDRDLWRWALPSSKAVNTALFIEEHCRGFAALDDLRANWDRDGLAVAGRSYTRYENTMVDKAKRVACRCRVPTTGGDNGAVLPEYTAYLVISTGFTSEIGNALMQDAPEDVSFAMVAQYSYKSDEYWVSMRTTRDNVNLSAIAPCVVGATKGGGHPKAAGFTLPGTAHLRTLYPLVEDATPVADAPAEKSE